MVACSQCKRTLPDCATSGRCERRTALVKRFAGRWAHDQVPDNVLKPIVCDVCGADHQASSALRRCIERVQHAWFEDHGPTKADLADMRNRLKTGEIGHRFRLLPAWEKHLTPGEWAAYLRLRAAHDKEAAP